MKTLLNLPNPQFINYCSEPLPKAKKNDHKKLSIDEINQLMAKYRNLQSFSWSMDYTVPDEWKLTDEDHQKISALTSRLISPENLVVCFINKEVGHGIFAKKKIKKGDIILYSGKMVPATNATSPYTLQVNDALALDSLEIGSYGCLFQDLYDPDIVVEDFINVAKNNFISRALTLSCGGISYLEAQEDIITAQCGLDYGQEYWNLLHIKNKISKSYFTTQGDIMSKMFSEYLQIKSLTVEQANSLKNPNRKPSSLQDCLASYTGNISTVMQREIAVLNTFPKPNIDESKKPLVSHLGKFTQKKLSPQQVLKKYNQATADTADIAFRKAAALGELDDIKVLLTSFKINVNNPSSNGMTALHWAYEKNKTEVINYLLRLDNINNEVQDELKRTPLQCKDNKLLSIVNKGSK